MDKTNILLTIGLGSVAGILIVNHLVKRSYAAAADDMDMMDMMMKMKGKKKMDMKKMMDMKMMDKAVMVKAKAPKCTCPDGKAVQSIAIPGMADAFSCPCMTLTGTLGQQGITGQLGKGVTVVPQAPSVRGMQLQTVPNQQALMPGQVGGLLAGSTALEAEAFAAMDDTDMQIMMALKDAGIGMAEQKKLMDSLKKQKTAVMKVAKETKCVCQDGTQVMSANGVCNCGAINTAGAIGLNRNIVGLPGQTGLQGKVPMPGTAMPGQAVAGQRGQMKMGKRMRQQDMPGQGAIPMGGVSPSNTGQVCILDPVDNAFKLSGTNVMCDPGPGLTAARDPSLEAIGQSPQPMLDERDISGASLTSLFGRAYLANSSVHGVDKSLALIPQDDEDLYQDYGDLRNAYPNVRVQDMVSPYDEDSHTVPFFMTEPESFRAISLQPANYPRR